jgi:hypothetical protein
LRDGAQVPAWFGLERPKREFPWETGKNGAYEHKPAVTRINDAVSCGCSEQDDKRFRFHLGRPRAAAHSWGKGARICTEINRLPRLALPCQAKIQTWREANSGDLAGEPGDSAFHLLHSLFLLDAGIGDSTQEIDAAAGVKRGEIGSRYSS